MKNYFIYILTNNSGTLYIGVTNDLERRMFEHKNKMIEGFTKKYNLNQLVYFEDTNSIVSAITREKELKGWLRKRKLDLIKQFNPTFQDLSKNI